MQNKSLILVLTMTMLACGKGNDDLNESQIPGHLNFQASVKKSLSNSDIENINNVFRDQEKSLLEASYFPLSKENGDLTKEQKAFVDLVRSKCSINSSPTSNSTTINEIKVGDVKTITQTASIIGDSCPVDDHIKGESVSKIVEIIEKSKGFFRGDSMLNLNSTASLKNPGTEKISEIVMTTKLTGNTVTKENVKAVYLKGELTSSLSNKTQALSSLSGTFHLLRVINKGDVVNELMFKGSLKTSTASYALDLFASNGELLHVYIDGNKMPIKQVGKMFSKFNQINSVLDSN